ncbi:hypothetical protein AUF17_19295 [Enterococcus avium]|uniref:HTH araC/xylS-type domain-containing protein n=1 Tax=Enterococcus avium TaxID=33945 RepID=A0A8B5VWB9_ENTAV|nr:hypothetical protein AUF17_19295 [Enterococcus avium]
MVNYQSESHFYRLLKKRFQLSPPSLNLRYSKQSQG